jgi:hypothetical protein
MHKRFVRLKEKDNIGGICTVSRTAAKCRQNGWWKTSREETIYEIQP